MAVDFTCPHCGHFSRIDDQFVGRTGPCASCGKPITVTQGPAGATQGKPSSSAAVVILSIVGAIMVCGGGVIVLLVLLMLPAINAAREAARRNGCLNQVRQISLALVNYEARYNSFPPAYTVDENGKPMTSWRVLILPELGYQSLYNQYNFDEPWDSPNNLAVAQQMPSEYGCPSDLDATSAGETSYMVIVGPETAFPGETTTRWRDMTDPTFGTILVVEVDGTGVGWTQPVDLPADQIDWQINGQPGNSIGSSHAGGVALVGFADGHVQPLSDQTSPQAVHDMSTIAGGEAVMLQ